MARSFREAEEASNAQGTVQSALDWAMQNAKANPTPANIAIMKDTAAAQQATVAANDPGKLVPTVTIGGAPAGYTPKALADAQAASAAVSSTLPEVDKAIADVNAAGTEAGNIAASMGGSPWSPITPVTPAQTGAPKDGTDYTDAFAILADQLRQWGLGSLADSFVSLAKSGMTPQEAMNKIKYNKEINPATGKAWNADYTVRFAGNQARLDKGLNALSEGSLQIILPMTYPQMSLGHVLTWLLPVLLTWTLIFKRTSKNTILL